MIVPVIFILGFFLQHPAPNMFSGRKENLG